MSITAVKREIAQGEVRNGAVSFAGQLASGETITTTSLASNSSDVVVSSVAATTAIETIDGLSVPIGQGLKFRVTVASTCVVGSYKLSGQQVTSQSQQPKCICPLVVIGGT